MANPRKCAVCEASLSSDEPEAICPTCAFRAALDAGSGPSERFDPASLFDLPSSEVKIRYFGDYNLLEQIGRGGMGVVYKARQVSLNRIVAVKMILAGKLASEADVQRFRAEAEAAARLQHPNIAAIYEIGEHEGHQYFSMALIDGENLDALAKSKEISPPGAAELVRKIAETIHYAHERGVLHRDLKPANVMVDKTGAPHLTDFGLARIEGGAAGTLPGDVLGSPGFISPEQAAGRAKLVGPRSDIYSLGAILFYLLAGRAPFQKETARKTIDAALLEEPISPRLLNPTTPRDLETICLKCLQSDPSRRYQTAQDCADELGRFLRGEPIHARPVGRAEKTWRWCKRNAPLAASLAAAIFLLFAGVVASTWQAVRATRAEHNQAQLRQQAQAAEKSAKSEAKRSLEVADFLKDMLASVNPSVARGRDTTLLREILDRSSERVGKSLKNQPDVEADLRNLLGNVYEALGEYPKAEAMHRRALELTKTAPGGKKENIAASLNNLAIVLDREGKFPEAETSFREALEIDRKLFGNEHRKIAKDMLNLGNVLWRQGKLAEAEQLHRDALAMNRKLLGNENPEIAAGLGSLGILAASRGKPAEAEALFREALALQQRLFPDGHPLIAQSMDNLGNSLADQRKLAEAEPVYRQGLALRRKLLGSEHPDVAISLNNLGGLLAKEGKFEEAEAMHREALAIRRKRLGNEHSFTILSMRQLAKALESQGKTDEAESLKREALAAEHKPGSNRPPE